MNHEVQYSWAVQGDLMAHISNASRHFGGFQCPACEGPMIARQGTKRQWHFAHNGKFCDIDRYTHKVAIQRLCEAMERVWAVGTPLTVTAPCVSPLGCSNRAQIDIHFGTITRERRHPCIPRIVPDITVNNAQNLCLEVIYTHELEPAARDAYLTAGLPVLMIKINPAMIDSASWPEQPLRAYDAINVICPRCRVEEPGFGFARLIQEPSDDLAKRQSDIPRKGLPVWLLDSDGLLGRPQMGMLYEAICAPNHEGCEHDKLIRRAATNLH